MERQSMNSSASTVATVDPAPAAAGDRSAPQTMVEHVSCNICGSADQTVVFEAGVAQKNRIVRCKNCGLMYASPRPVVYAHEALLARTDDELSEAERVYMVQRIEKERLQVRDYDPTRKYINSLYPERGRLLEVGSGFGYLLAAFCADGWTVKGVDPDRQASAYARDHNNIDAVTGTLADLATDTPLFDVVVMNHVIEHVPDPVDLLKSIYNVLKPGGRFVVETPCYDSLMFWLLGRRERSLSCDGHIYFYTKATLLETLGRAGFSPERFERVGRSLTVNRLAYNLGVMSKSRAFKNFIEDFTRSMGLNKVSIHLT